MIHDTKSLEPGFSSELQTLFFRFLCAKMRLVVLYKMNQYPHQYEMDIAE